MRKLYHTKAFDSFLQFVKSTSGTFIISPPNISPIHGRFPSFFQKLASKIWLCFFLFCHYLPNAISQEGGNDSLYQIYINSELPERINHLETYIKSSYKLDPLVAVDLLKTEIAALEKLDKYPVKLAYLYYLIFDRYRYAHKFHEGSPYISKMMQLIEKYADGSRDWDKVNATAHVAMSDIYRWEEKKEEHAAELEKSLALYEKIKDSSNIATTTVNLGIAYSELGDSERAVKNFEQGEEYFLRLGNEGYALLSRFFQAVDLTLLGKYDRAQRILEDNLDKIKEVSSVHYIGGLRTLGDIMTQTGKLKEAEILLDSAYSMVIKTGNFNSISTAALKQSELHKKKGDFKRAFEFLEIRANYQDSLFQQVLDDKNAQTIAQYEDLNKALRIKELEKEKALAAAQHQIRMTLILAVSIFGFCLLGFLIYWQRQKAKREIAAASKTVLFAWAENHKDYLEVEPAVEINPFVKSFLAALEERLDDENLNVDSLADQFKMSRVLLYQKIKAATGASPSEILRQYRLETAKRLLQKSDLTISEIAYRVGFSNPNSFTRAFKGKFGSPPSSYLNQN